MFFVNIIVSKQYNILISLNVWAGLNKLLCFYFITKVRVIFVIGLIFLFFFEKKHKKLTNTKY